MTPSTEVAREIAQVDHGAGEDVYVVRPTLYCPRAAQCEGCGDARGLTVRVLSGVLDQTPCPLCITLRTWCWDEFDVRVDPYLPVRWGRYAQLVALHARHGQG